MGIMLNVEMTTAGLVSAAKAGEKAVDDLGKSVSGLQTKANKGVKIAGLNSANEQLDLAGKNATRTTKELALLQGAAPVAFKAADKVIDNAVQYIFDSMKDKRETRSVPELYAPDIRGSSAEKILANDEFNKFVKDIASMSTHDLLIRHREETLRIEDIQAKFDDLRTDSWFEKNQFSWAYRKALDNLNEHSDDLKEQDVQDFDRNLEKIYEVHGTSFNTEETDRHQDLRSLGIQLKDAQARKARIEKEQLKRNQREPAYEQGNKGAFEKEPLKQEEPREQKTYEAPDDWGYLAQIEPGAGTVAALEAGNQAYLDSDYPSRIAGQWADMPIEEATQGIQQSADTLLQSGETLAQGTVQQAEQASAAVLGTVEESSANMLGNQQNFAQQYDAQADSFTAGSLQDADAWQNELAGQLEHGDAERLGLTEDYITEQKGLVDQGWKERLQTEEDNQDRLAELQRSGQAGGAGPGGDPTGGLPAGGGLAGSDNFAGSGGRSGSDWQSDSGMPSMPYEEGTPSFSSGGGGMASGLPGGGLSIGGDGGGSLLDMPAMLGEAWGGFFSDFTTGFSNSIGQAIWESESLGDSLYNVATGALSSLTSGIINMGIQWGISEMMQLASTESAVTGMAAEEVAVAGLSAASTTAITTEQATSTAAAAETATAWAPAAATASIGSFGTAAAIALVGIAAVMALTGGFAQGGYTGNIGRRKVAGVVHGQEFVFDAEAVDRIGVGQLEALRSGEDMLSGKDVLGVSSGNGNAGLLEALRSAAGFGGYGSGSGAAGGMTLAALMLAESASLSGGSANYGPGGLGGFGASSASFDRAEAMEREMWQYAMERQIQESRDRDAQAQDSLAAMVGMSGANLNVSIENYGSNKEFEVKRLSPEDVRIIARDVMRRETPRFVAQEIANPNSDISKGFAYSTNIRRRR